MNVKIDTKEKFTVLTPIESHISANMTASLAELLHPYLQKAPPHIVFNMEAVEAVEPLAMEKITSLQQQFYEKQCSFVICNMQDAVEKSFDEHNFLELLNVTPTESEAWDIVQIEEIERELFGDE